MSRPLQFLILAALGTSVFGIAWIAIWLMKRNDDPARAFIRVCCVVLAFSVACGSGLVGLQVMFAGRLSSADVTELERALTRLIFVVAILVIVGIMIHAQKITGSALTRRDSKAD